MTGGELAARVSRGIFVWNSVVIWVGDSTGVWCARRLAWSVYCSMLIEGKEGLIGGSVSWAVCGFGAPGGVEPGPLVWLSESGKVLSSTGAAIGLGGLIACSIANTFGILPCRACMRRLRSL